MILAIPTDSLANQGQFQNRKLYSQCSDLTNIAFKRKEDSLISIYERNKQIAKIT